jgi:hypothetical protein
MFPADARGTGRTPGSASANLRGGNRGRFGEAGVRHYGDYMSGGTVKPFLPLLLRFLLFDRAAGFLPPRP